MQRHLSRCWLDGDDDLSVAQNIGERGETTRLLNAVIVDFAAYQGVKDGQHMPPVLEHARENISQLRFALRFAVPLGQYRGRYFDVLAQLFRRMPPQKQSVEKCRFSLRIFEIHGDFGWDEGGQSRHRKSAVYPKTFPRQVGPGLPCTPLVNPGRPVFEQASNLGLS